MQSQIKSQDGILQKTFVDFYNSQNINPRIIIENFMKKKLVEEGVLGNDGELLWDSPTISFPKNKKKVKKSSTGIKGVKKCKCSVVNQGFTFRYSWLDENGKQKIVESINPNILKSKVLDLGFEWIVEDEELAEKTMNHEPEPRKSKPSTGIEYLYKITIGYRYQHNGNLKTSKDVNKVKEWVLSKNLPWKIWNEDLARKTMNSNLDILKEIVGIFFREDRNSFQIQRDVNRKHYSFGTYPLTSYSVEDVLKLHQFIYSLSKTDAIKFSSFSTKLKGQEYRDFIQNKMIEKEASLNE